MKHLLKASLCVLIAICYVACSKSGGSVDKSQQTDISPKSTNVVDLGEVELTPQVANRFKLEPGKECTIVPAVLPDGNLKIEVTVEAKNADGVVTKQLGKARTVVQPGQQFTVSAGDSIIGLTPRIKSN